MTRFAPPAFLKEFALVNGQEQAWSDFIETATRLEIRRLERRSPAPFSEPGLGDGKAQYYNPLRQFADLDVLDVDIAWSGFPRTLTVLHPDDPFPLAERRPQNFIRLIDREGRAIQGLTYRAQEEYLEWRAEYSQNAQLTRVTFTCEGPEYWSALADGYPALYFTGNDSRPLSPPPGNRELVTALYRRLVSADVRAEDLFFDRDIFLVSGSPPVFPRGSYNPWNRWNTTDGIVHLSHPHNVLRAEINLAARATRKRMKGNRIITDAAELICCSGYGVPTRASDMIIGAKINELARENLSVTLANPVGLYMDGLDVSGWTEPVDVNRPELGRRPVGDYLRVVRPEWPQAREQRRILRAVYEVPAGQGFTISDIQINGRPIINAGQIAACITMKLTGWAVAGGVTDAPARMCVARCCRCRANPDDLIIVDRVSKPCTERAAELGNLSPCVAGFEEAFPPPEPPTGPPDANATIGPAFGMPADTRGFFTAEPPLELNDIQGNILSGFRNDFQTFVFYRIDDVEKAREWLAGLPISPESAVHRHNQRFREIGAAAGDAVWLNIAFSYRGLERLAPDTRLFRDPAFNPHRANPGAASLPEPPGKPFDKRRLADILLIAAADNDDALQALLKQTTPPAGLTELERDEGRVRQDKPNGVSMSGHEHFGFRDGISQPGIRGRILEEDGAYFTPRPLREQNPAHPRAADFGRAGQPLVYPGQFVFGYPTQTAVPHLPGPDALGGPEWSRNGSFVVYQRFTQDVEAFWTTMQEQADKFTRQGHPGITAEWIASRLLGRWPSGVPTLRSPNGDDPAFAAQPAAADAMNNFDFIDNRNAIPDGLTATNQPQNDALGKVCPFVAHIRKMNPRDDATDIGGGGASLTRRILRRGLTFGEPVKDIWKLTDGERKTERGILFVSYQTSLINQFEFLIAGWMNHALNPRSIGRKKIQGGRDIAISQSDAPTRKATVFAPDGKNLLEIEVNRPFLGHTGGGYFFAPSLSALRSVLASRG